MNGLAVLLSVVCLCAGLSVGVAAAGERPWPAAIASDGSPSDTVCAPGGRLPATVRIDGPLVRHVDSMLARSADFRRQCRLLADYPQVYVRVRLALTDLPANIHAQSQVHRTTAGPLLVFVTIAAVGNWSEWLGHEFEHVIELAEGMRERDYRRGHGTWESGSSVYESDRAIAAGRAVRLQMARKGVTAND